jgi:cell division transport system permease protein
LSGFSEMLDTLPDNPLPPVIIVHPSFTDPKALEQLQEKLQKLPEVALVQLDLAWVQRLSALLHLGENIVWILMLFLSVAVVLIIGNTIRLAIFNRQDEIVVIKLVGGTNAFIRRPFLYTGIWYGLFGAALAIIMVSGALIVLNSSIQSLAQSYQSHFQVLGLGPERGLDLLLLGALLGWLGAAIFVHYHLKRIEP